MTNKNTKMRINAHLGLQELLSMSVDTLQDALGDPDQLPNKMALVNAAAVVMANLNYAKTINNLLTRTEEERRPGDFDDLIYFSNEEL